MSTFFYSKNIIPIRSNKSKTFLICNQALRVPTEICDSNNISVCIKSRVDNLFKFLCSSAPLKLLLLKSLLLLLSLPNLYKCFSFAQPGIPPHFRCLSYSIYSLIASSCIEGNLQKMERLGKGKARIEPTESVGVTSGFRQMSLCGVNAILSESQKGSTLACEISQRKD